jgi:glycosyltransferase involved in cell wall biosynthesis
MGSPALPASLRRTDIVHVTNHAAVAPAASGQKLVVAIHDLAVEHYPQAFTPRWRWLYRAGLRAAMKRADALLVPSQSTAKDLLDRGANPVKIHVTPLAPSTSAGGADAEEVLTRLRIPSPFLLFVGTLEPRKNLPRLVRAYRRAVAARSLPHALVLAGPMGWGTQELLHELATEGQGRVVRTGRLAPADLDALYRSAAGFAYPSLYEGFGMPVLEAMGRGVPTLTSNTSSLPEVTGGAAVLIDPTDESAIAAGLEGLLTDEGLARRLREAGPLRAQGYTWGATARATLEVYRQLLELD